MLDYRPNRFVLHHIYFENMMCLLGEADLKNKWGREKLVETRRNVES
jgi:hypothetical protein